MVQSDYKPNINDLKQLFDDSKRINVDKLQQQQHFQQMQQQKAYYDAKPSFLEQEIFTECKNRADFERVKQKFDGKPQNNMKIPSIANKFGNSSIPSSSSSKQQNSSNLLRKHPNTASGSSNIHKTDNLFLEGNNPSTSCSSLNNKININETIQFFDSETSRIAINKNLCQAQALPGSSKRMNEEDNGGNFNLDGFKVSEDDEDDDDVSIDIAACFGVSIPNAE